MRDMHLDMARLRGLDRPYAQEALRRLALLAEWERARFDAAELGLGARQADAAFFARLEDRGDTVSRASLYGWRRAYRADGWRGLIDQRTRHDRPQPPLAFLEEVASQFKRHLYLGRQRALQVAHHEAANIAARRGWRTCTLREAERFIRKQIPPSSRRGRGGAGGG